MRTAILMALFVSVTIIGIGRIWVSVDNTSAETAATGKNQIDSKRVSATRENVEELNARIDLALRRVEDVALRLDDATGQMTLLRKQLALVEGNDQLQRAVKNTPALEPGALETAGSPEQVTAERGKALMRAHADLIENTIKSEPGDLEWTNSVRTTLEEMFLSEKFADIQVLGTECGSTLCRIRFYLDDRGSTQDGIQRLARIAPTMPASAESWIRTENTETGEAVMYLARQGHPMPRY